MSNHTAARLLKNRERILEVWRQRAFAEVAAAKGITKLALSNELSKFLSQLAEMLNSRGKTRIQSNQEASIRQLTSQAHGSTRAASRGYLIEEVIAEYQILRQVIFQVLEEEEPLAPGDRDIILDGIEKAVNDSASKFSNTLRDIREHFTTTLTHDLRTPLTAAKSAAELILRRPENREFCTKSAFMISTTLDRLDRMIQDILTASRIRSGEIPRLEMTDVDLAAVAHEVTDEFSLSYPGRLMLNIEGETVGHWNRVGLRRVLENLIANAFKYGDSSSPVIVSIKGLGKRVRFAVHNEGNPIPPDQQEILFQQFRRAKSAETKTGWGLGLLLAKGLVEAHGGTIRVESALARGTDFIVELPWSAEEVEAA